MFEEVPPDVEIAARSGRSFPYATVGQWVLLADIVPQAKTLYAMLRMHVSGSRGDNEAWPTQATLAGLMSLKKHSDVGKYTRVLQALGAVEVEVIRWGPNRMYQRIIYTVHEVSPEEYAGHRDLKSYYLERNAKHQVAPVVPSEVPPVVPLKGSPDIPPSAPPVIPSGGCPVIPLKGRPVVPSEGQELPELLTTRTEKETESGAAAPASAPRCAAGRVGVALDQEGSPSGGDPEKTQVLEVTHHTRAPKKLYGRKIVNYPRAIGDDGTARPPMINAEGPDDLAAGDSVTRTACGQLWPVAVGEPPL